MLIIVIDIINILFKLEAAQFVNSLFQKILLARKYVSEALKCAQPK